MGFDLIEKRLLPPAGASDLQGRKRREPSPDELQPGSEGWLERLLWAVRGDEEQLTARLRELPARWQWPARIVLARIAGPRRAAAICARVWSAPVERAW